MISTKESIFNRQEDFPLLSPGEMHVWQVSTNISPSKLAEYKNILTESELAKASFFEFEECG